MNKSILVTMCVVSILIILLLINTVQSYSQPDNKTEIIVRFIPGIIEFDLPPAIPPDVKLEIPFFCVSLQTLQGSDSRGICVA